MKNEFFENIDWKLLRDQKLYLLSQESEEVDGLINLLDSMQDYAVYDLKISEEIVFPNMK